MPRIIKNDTDSYIIKNGVTYGDGLNGYVIKNGIYYNYDMIFRRNYPTIGTLEDTQIRNLPYYENGTSSSWSLTDSLDNYNLFQLVFYHSTTHYDIFPFQVIVSKERLVNSDYWHPIMITYDVNLYIYNYPDESDKLCAALSIDTPHPQGGDRLVLRGIN